MGRTPNIVSGPISGIRRVVNMLTTRKYSKGDTTPG